MEKIRVFNSIKKGVEVGDVFIARYAVVEQGDAVDLEKINENHTDNHYCIICKKTEKCRDEVSQDCDYRVTLLAHGNCFAELDMDKKIEHEKIAEILRIDGARF